MTNQVNQDAFEKWFQSNMVDPTIGIFDTDPRSVSESTWQAATQASESEINSLKQLVEDLDMSVAIYDYNYDSLKHENKRLQADNNQLREALSHADEELAKDNWRGDVKEFIKDALSSTPTQSLAEHDNEVIDRCKNIVADDALAIMFQSMGAYRSAIIKQIGELKATP